MGADQTVLPLTIEYSVPIFVGLIFMFAWFVSDSILRAQGNSKIPMRNLAISIVINIILDPILIFGLGPVPAMGIQGAAFATVFSRIVATVLNFAYIYSPKSTISFSLRDFRPNANYVKRMLVIGLPASAAQTLTAGGFMLLMGIVGSFGSLAIAAFGIGLKINSVIIMPMIGTSMAVVSMVGQNFGTGNNERAKQIALLGRRFTLATGILFAGIVLSFPEQIMRIFTSNAEVIAIGKAIFQLRRLDTLFMAPTLHFMGHCREPEKHIA